MQQIDAWKRAVVEATEPASLDAVEAMTLHLMRRVMDTRIGWSASDAHSPEASSALMRVTQGTLEQFLSRWGYIRSRNAHQR